MTITGLGLREQGVAMTRVKRGVWRWLGFTVAGIFALAAGGLVWLLLLGGVALTDRAMLW